MGCRSNAHPFERAAIRCLELALLALSVCTHAPAASAVPTFDIHPQEQTLKLPMIEGRDLQFKHLTTAGLSQTRVAQITQDDKGFIWLGTQNGLNRYDGYRFKVFKHDPERKTSLSGVYIYSLFKDRAGMLWVGSDQFLDRFDPSTEKFSRYHVAADDSTGVNFEDISQDKQGDIWLGTRNGLYRVNPQTSATSHYRHDPSDQSTLSDSDAKMAGEDRAGAFWVSTSAGLDRFDRNSGKVLTHLNLGYSGAGLQFHQDRAGLFWIISGSDGRLAVFDQKANRLIRYIPQPVKPLASATSPFFTTLLEDRDGTMWFGTGGYGLLKFDRERQLFRSYTPRPGDPDSLSDTRVIALFQDKEGNIWTGLHQSAPDFFSPRPAEFRKFTFELGNPESLASRLVSVIYQDTSGVLWIGADQSIKRFSPQWDHASIFPAIQGREVLSIVEQSPGVLWFATAGQGLTKYDQKMGKLVTYHANPSDPSTICSDFIEKLLIDHKGGIWAATWGGLSRFDPADERFTTFRPDSSTGLNYHAITESGDGMIWLGSNLGLWRFDPASRQFQSLRHESKEPASLSDNRVNSILQTRSGDLWIGTQNGLDLFKPASKTFEHFTERDGIGGNVVSCILEDQRGHLWMSTNRGISQFAPATRGFKNYTIADGLPGPDLTGWGACSRSQSGEMFFGGFSGAVAFDPANVRDATYVPPVVLTDFKLFGSSLDLVPGSPLKKSIAYADSISLTRTQNFFSIEFSALSYANAAANRYRYKLEGLQSQWTETDSAQRLATYTTLPAGSYTFRVQGATGRGTWSDSVGSLQIEILPPFWRTTWFETICAILLCISLWAIYRMRLHQITSQYSLRVEERFQERSRIARELHDTLLQSFQGLILRFQAAQTLLPDRPLEAKQSLQISIGRAAAAVTEGRQAVQELRSAALDSEQVVETLTSIGQQLAADYNAETDGTHRVEFRLSVEGTPRRLQLWLCEEICRIVREALTNAFRHAQPGRIELNVRFTARALQVRVRDDGAGMDKTFLQNKGREGHWGLAGMYERAGKIGAHLEVSSEHGSGTEVHLTLPAVVAYPNSPRWHFGLFNREGTDT